MKSSKLIFKLICVGLIIVSILGLFEESAFQFLTDVAKKNTDFLAVISEIKMIVTGLSSINVPFVSGHTQGIEDSLDKVQNYLLLTDIITFLQIIFLSISKSFLFKLVLVALFALTFFDKNKRLFSKFLIIALALSPGLSIYTVAVNHISNASQIDFGDSYLKELKASANAITQENAQLMKEHNRQITKINNGQKGLILMRKLKEDVSYDVKKAKTDIKGDFVHIRGLIKSAGHEMLSKVFRFCTMILFCLLLLPIGYTMLVKMLIKSQFGNLALEGILKKMPLPDMQKLEQEVKEKSFFQKLVNIGKTIRTEFTKVEQEVEHSKEFQDLEQRVKQTENKVTSDIQKAIHKKENDLKNSAKAIEGKVIGNITDEESVLRDKIENVTSTIKNNISSEENEARDEADQLKEDVQSSINKGEYAVEKKVEQVKSAVHNDVSKVENKVKDTADQLKQDVQDSINKGKYVVDEKAGQVKSTIQGDVSKAENKVKDTASQLKEKAKKDDSNRRSSLVSM